MMEGVGKLLGISIGDKVLITTDNWFVAPDGSECRAVFGTVHGVFDSETTLGIKTNDRSTNWYVKIGRMIVAGCQIHYVIKSDDAHNGDARAWSSSAEYGIKTFDRPCITYFAD